ncbi:MAG: hypothetical protein H7Y60_02260 [Rhodospirillaceae bacterium]|nr:hypothetical protein [Rhodospirillales bacterium]
MYIFDKATVTKLDIKIRQLTVICTTLRRMGISDKEIDEALRTLAKTFLQFLEGKNPDQLPTETAQAICRTGFELGIWTTGDGVQFWIISVVGVLLTRGADMDGLND